MEYYYVAISKTGTLTSDVIDGFVEATDVQDAIFNVLRGYSHEKGAYVLNIYRDQKAYLMDEASIGRWMSEKAAKEWLD